MVTKTGLMLGLGESWDEVLEAMRLLREADVDVLTIGQYLRPSRQHLPLHKYYTPAEFISLRRIGLEMGFAHVQSGPLVRSSYHAAEQVPGRPRRRLTRRAKSDPPMTTMRDISVAPPRMRPDAAPAAARPPLHARQRRATPHRRAWRDPDRRAAGDRPLRPAWELQDELADQRRHRRIGDRLLLLEHFPVYTIGRGGDEANLLAGPIACASWAPNSCASIAAATSPSMGRASSSPTPSSSCATRSTCAATSAAWRRPSSRPPPPSASPRAASRP